MNLTYLLIPVIISILLLRNNESLDASHYQMVARIVGMRGQTAKIWGPRDPLIWWKHTEGWCGAFEMLILK